MSMETSWKGYVGGSSNTSGLVGLLGEDTWQAS